MSYIFRFRCGSLAKNFGFFESGSAALTLLCIRAQAGRTWNWKGMARTVRMKSAMARLAMYMLVTVRMRLNSKKLLIWTYKININPLVPNVD